MRMRNQRWVLKPKRASAGDNTRQASKVRRDVVNGWLALAIAHKKEGGLGLTLKDAVSMIKAKMSDLPSEETLRRYWNDVRQTQSEIFKIKTD